MDYQAVRSKFESSLNTAYGALSPAIPVYFDNTLNTISDAESEFIHVNLQFGATTEQTLSTVFDYIQGTIVIRAFTEKGKGPARNQTLISTAVSELRSLSNTAKASTGVYVRIGPITGPSFGTGSTAQESRVSFTPYFISRIDTTFTAQVIS